MTVVQVYYRLKGRGEENIRQEVNLRKQCFFTAVSAGVKVDGSNLKYHWQLWEIPEVDGHITERDIFATVREMTEEEKEFVKRLKE